LLVLSTVIDYTVGLWMEREEDGRLRKVLLVTSLVSNLGILAIFKYYNFFMDVAGQGLTLLGASTDLSFLYHRLLLPVGISFYTFQTLSYTIDVYKREIPAERSFMKFAL